MSDHSRPTVSEEISIPSGGSEDPFASAVRTTRMPMVITDPRRQDNPIVFCNDAFVELTGYDRDEILGRNCRFLQGPATRAADVAVIREGINSRVPSQVDMLNYRKDGTTFWNALLVSPVFVSDELTYFFASQLDVTDRKRSEERAFLLHRELDHRVKNTLATVQSLVLQTLRDSSVPQNVADAVAGRLHALARSHDVLSTEAWSSALMADIIDGALLPFTERFPGQISVEGPDLRIRSRIATMLSLAIHELADNAARHGSLTSDKGTVAISWTIDDGQLHLEWLENGGPAVTTPSKRGYGLKIVETVLAAEFGGTASVEFSPDGLIFQLDASTAGLDTEQSEWATRSQ